MRFYGLSILLVRPLAKNLANAILWLMRICPGPKSHIRQEPSVSYNKINFAGFRGIGDFFCKFLSNCFKPKHAIAMPLIENDR